jgi:hypothetical protein
MTLARAVLMDQIFLLLFLNQDAIYGLSLALRERLSAGNGGI